MNTLSILMLAGLGTPEIIILLGALGILGFIIYKVVYYKVYHDIKKKEEENKK